MKKYAVMAAILTATILSPLPATAQTEIQWWHAMTGANNDVVVRLANDFNASQQDYKVVPVFKGSYADTMNAGIAAYRSGNAPHILQVFEVGTATMMAAKGAVKPVQDVMKDAGESFDPKIYLPAITGYYSTTKGEMLSFPFNSSSMVMWVKPRPVEDSWPQSRHAAQDLAGSVRCGCKAEDCQPDLRLLNRLDDMGQYRTAVRLA